MTYTELKKRIKAASSDQKKDGIQAYITYSGDTVESLQSNFITNCEGISDNQLIKAVEQGILVKDWDTFLVV